MNVLRLAIALLGMGAAAAPVAAGSASAFFNVNILLLNPAAPGLVTDAPPTAGPITVVPGPPTPVVTLPPVATAPGPGSTAGTGGAVAVPPAAPADTTAGAGTSPPASPGVAVAANPVPAAETATAIVPPFVQFPRVTTAAVGCTSQTQAQASDATVRVMCSGVPYVTIAPSPGQFASASYGGTSRYPFGSGTLLGGGGATLMANSGTVTTLNLSNISNTPFAPLEMLVSF